MYHETKVTSATVLYIFSLLTGVAAVWLYMTPPTESSKSELPELTELTVEMEQQVEEDVQDAFVSVYKSWRAGIDPDQYLTLEDFMQDAFKVSSKQRIKQANALLVEQKVPQNTNYEPKVYNNVWWFPAGLSFLLFFMGSIFLWSSSSLYEARVKMLNAKRERLKIQNHRDMEDIERFRRYMDNMEILAEAQINGTR